MSLRSRAREVALQILFEDELNPRQTANELQQFVAGRLKPEEAREFCTSLILGVRRNLDEIDPSIENIADNWALSRMARTDRNVLRLATYEILFTDTPFRVAIDEAIELARRFGGKQSASFVNGILDKLPRRDEA